MCFRKDFYKQNESVVSMNRGISLLIIMLIPIFSIISFGNTQSTIHVYYSRYDSVYSVTGVPKIMPIAGGSSVIYTVTSTVFNSSVTGNNQALHATYNKTAYILYFGEIKTYSGKISVSVYTNNTIKVSTSIPNLIRVIIMSAGEEELVWAGIASSNSTINALAYVNGSGKAILEFANGSSIVNVTLPVKINATTTLDENLKLSVISQISIKTTEEGQISIQTQVPRKYSPLMLDVNYNGSTWSNASGYSVTVAYFNGSLTPAIVWKGLGVIGVHGIIGSELNTSAETIEFYGVNGTVLGYVHIASVSGSLSNSILISTHNASVQFSEVKIVTVEGVKPVHSQFMGITFLNGNEVIVEGNTSGVVTSTANVNFTHVVKVSHKVGVLVLISINTTSRFIVVTEDNYTANVTTVKPVNVTNTTLQLNGEAYISQKVIVNNSSKYILFNVSVLANNSAIVVYKVVNGQLIQLNSSNYFTANGKVIVFDDPSTTYYVVYTNKTVPQTTTQSSSTISTSSTTTSSTSVSSSSESTTSSLSGIPAPIPPPTSTSSSSSNLLYVGIAIAIVLIVVGLIVALRRK